MLLFSIPGIGTSKLHSIAFTKILFTFSFLVKRKGLYSKGGLAAQPGTSNHGWGSAVDLNFKVGKGNALEWLKKNAGKYGFTNIPREPWHWEHKQSAKNMGANTSNTTDDSQSSTHLDSDEGSSVGGDLLKGILSTNLGLDTLASGFAGVQENIIRIKQLMK
jgi:hypothetical protein